MLLLELEDELGLESPVWLAPEPGFDPSPEMELRQETELKL